MLLSERLPSQVPKRPFGFIQNVDSSGEPGTHWVAVYLSSDVKEEFFDLYGKPPEFYSGTFRTFLQDCSGAFTWNELALQSPWSLLVAYKGGHYEHDLLGKLGILLFNLEKITCLKVPHLFDEMLWLQTCSNHTDPNTTTAQRSKWRLLGFG